MHETINFFFCDSWTQYKKGLNRYVIIPTNHLFCFSSPKHDKISIKISVKVKIQKNNFMISREKKMLLLTEAGDEEPGESGKGGSFSNQLVEDARRPRPPVTRLLCTKWLPWATQGWNISWLTDLIESEGKKWHTYFTS